MIEATILRYGARFCSSLKKGTDVARVLVGTEGFEGAANFPTDVRVGILNPAPARRLHRVNCRVTEIRKKDEMRTKPYLPIALALLLAACSSAVPPATSTPPPPSTATLTPGPPPTPTGTALPTPLPGKGSISLEVSCIFGVSPQGFTLYMPVGAGYPMLLILVDLQSMTYIPVASVQTDAESRVLFNDIEPGAYSVYFGVASLEIPAHQTISVNIIANETQDLGEIQLLRLCADIFTR